MKTFLVKSTILSVVVLVIHFGLAQLADGYSDPYYNKLASSNQDALILGASRASEGIIPSVIDSVLQRTGQQKGFFNFAFTDSDTPYGEVYLNAIKKKLNRDSKKSIFILSVHPWSVSKRITLKKGLREDNLALSKMTHFSGQPNYDYLLNGYEYGWGNILLKKMENKIFDVLGTTGIVKNGAWSYVHKDGWLEVKFLNNDSTFFAKKADEKLQQKYNYSFSSQRLDYLKKIIDELNKHGLVYLVRLPIDKRMVDLENEVIPNFKEIMQDLAIKKGASYLDYSSNSDEYNYSDGSHFVKSSAVKFSIELANKILK